MNKYFSPHLYAFGAFFFFALVNSCIKSLDGEVQIPLILFMRFTISFTMLALMTGSLRSLQKKLQTRHLKIHIFRAFIGVIATSAIFFVMPHVPLAEINLLGQTYPFSLMILSTYILKEPPKAKQYLSCILGFVGVLLIVRPSGDIGMLPALLVLTAALLNAISDISTRWMVRTEHEITIVLWFFLLSSFFSLIWSLFSVTDYDLTLREWQYIICAGILSSTAQYLLIKAYKHLKAGAIAPYSYVSLCLSIVFGWMIFHEIPTMWMVAGGLFIMAGVQWNYLVSRKSRSD